MKVARSESRIDATFEEVYNMFYKPGVSFLTHLIKDKQEAENLVQDVFVKLWVRKERMIFDLELKPYIFKSLRNIAFDYFKNMERNQELRESYLKKMSEFGDHDDMHDLNVPELVNNAIDGLSEKRTQIVRMSYLDGKSYHEIAKSLKISKNTVKNQLVSARKLLRNSLTPLVFN